MSIQSICRYLFILIFSFSLISASGPLRAQQATPVADTVAPIKVKKVDSAGHQLCLGVDVFHLIEDQFLNDRKAYEFSADYYLHNEFYSVVELGWGSGNVNYSDLKYTTTNNFIRFGFNKTVLPRDNPRDWDMMLFGLRLAAAEIKRSSATYVVTDSLWGNTPPTTIGARPPFVAVWAELTAGMRVAIVNNLFAGWNIRGKFMMNGKSFNDLSPLYIAGYGRGDKNTAFDFNLYISYAIRWKRNSIMAKEEAKK